MVFQGLSAVPGPSSDAPRRGRPDVIVGGAQRGCGEKDEED